MEHEREEFMNTGSRKVKSAVNGQMSLNELLDQIEWRLREASKSSWNAAQLLALALKDVPTLVGSLRRALAGFRSVLGESYLGATQEEHLACLHCGSVNEKAHDAIQDLSKLLRAGEAPSVPERTESSDVRGVSKQDS